MHVPSFSQHKYSFVVFSFSCLVELNLTSREVPLKQCYNRYSLFALSASSSERVLRKSVQIETGILIFTVFSPAHANLCTEPSGFFEKASVTYPLC